MKRIHVLALVVAGLFVTVVACGKKEAPEARQEGEEVSKNPIRAAQQVSEAAEKAAQAMKEAQEMKPVEPVHFSKLIELLPGTPSGWQAEEPTGETSSGMGFKVSQAGRHYTKEGASAEVSIMDGAFNGPLYAFVTMASQFSRETTEGFEKGVTIDGNPGIEKWQKNDKDAELTIVVAKRYIVSVKANGEGVDSEFVRKLLEKVDRAKLAKLGG